MTQGGALCVGRGDMSWTSGAGHWEPPRYEGDPSKQCRETGERRPDVGQGTVEVGHRQRHTVRDTGARLAVESADAASAYGHLRFLVIAAELAQWPTTRAAPALCEALVSGLPKLPDSRRAILTTAGDPAPWSAKVLDAARTSDRWRVSEVRGLGHILGVPGAYDNQRRRT